MSYIKLFFVFLLFSFIQFIILPNFSIRGAFPNLLFIYVILLILNSRYKKSIFFAILSGIFYDVFSLSYPGMYLISFLAIALGLNFILKKYISSPNIIFIIFIFFTCSLLLDLPAVIVGNRDYLLYLYVGLYNTIFGTTLYYLLGDYLRPQKPTYKMKLK